MTVQLCTDPDEAVAGIADGSTVLVGGFGMAGMPVTLIDALIRQGARDLTIVSDNAGNGETGLAALLAKRRARKVVCSFPRQADSHRLRRVVPERRHRARSGAAPVMATAATSVVVQVREVVATGDIDPETVVPRCTYPLTVLGCVDLFHTDHSVFDITEQGVVVREAFGVTVAELAGLLEVPVR